jgi:hypothetical protein
MRFQNLRRHRHLFNAPLCPVVKRRFCVNFFEPAVPPGASTPLRIQITVLIGETSCQQRTQFYFLSRPLRSRPRILANFGRRSCARTIFRLCLVWTRETPDTAPLFIFRFSAAHFFSALYSPSAALSGQRRRGEEEGEVGQRRAFFFFIAFLFRFFLRMFLIVPQQGECKRAWGLDLEFRFSVVVGLFTVAELSTLADDSAGP